MSLSVHLLFLLYQLIEVHNFIPTIPITRKGPRAKLSFRPIFPAASIMLTYMPLNMIPSIAAYVITFTPFRKPDTAISFISPPPNPPFNRTVNTSIGTAMTTVPGQTLPHGITFPYRQVSGFLYVSTAQ